MLSNLIINDKKCILFIDAIGFERHSEKIIKDCLHDVNDTNYIIHPDKNSEIDYQDETFKSVNIINNKTNIIFQPISKLIQYYKIETIFEEINRYLFDDKISRVFLWVTVSNISPTFVVQFLEYVSDIVVTFQQLNNLTVLTKKSRGDAKLKSYTYEPIENKNNSHTIFVKEIKTNIVKPAEPSINPEDLGTFKIKIEDEEMIARNALKLPYEKARDTATVESSSKKSQIIYSPDGDDDDYDDEDPDDDLDI